MIPTLFGALVAAIGLLLLVGRGVASMLVYLTIVSLFGGAAAILLPALGGSSIPPVELAIGFMTLRILVPGGGQIGHVAAAIRANLLLVLFVAFGVVMAFVGPRMFAYRMNVVPMRFVQLNSLLATFPLVPTSQNITTAVYMVGTLLAAIGAYVAGCNRRTPLLFVKAGVVLAWLHVATGIFGALVRGTPLSAVIDFFRNGNYAQTDQFYGGYARINGIMPEPSTYAMFAFSWFVFMLEAWWRDVLPRWTGPAALGLLAVLTASTSSTAYAGLAGYAALIAIRMLLFPHGLRVGKAIAVGALTMATLIACCLAIAAKPAILQQFAVVLSDMTISKSSSASGIQRAFWAYKGLEAFRVSGGLGIGPGSFRSSSLVTAILGSTGVIGVLLFTAYTLQILKPLRRSTYLRPADPEEGAGVAAAWAAFVILIPSAVMSSAPDPGVTFAVFAGLSLALRRSGVRVPGRRPVPAITGSVPAS